MTRTLPDRPCPPRDRRRLCGGARRARTQPQGCGCRHPRDALVVFSGVSGSGKSSLAFGTLYAEAQRRYFESVAPYARRLIDRWACRMSTRSMDCPGCGAATTTRCEQCPFLGRQRDQPVQPGAHVVLARWHLPQRPADAVCRRLLGQYTARGLPGVPWPGARL